MRSDLLSKNMMSGILCVGIGAAVSLFLSVAAVAIGAYLLSADLLSDSFVKLYLVAVWVLACLIGCCTAGILYGKQYLILCASNSALYFLILLSACILLFDGTFDTVWMPLLSVVAGGAGGYLICNGKNLLLSPKTRLRYP